MTMGFSISLISSEMMIGLSLELHYLIVNKRLIALCNFSPKEFFSGNNDTNCFIIRHNKLNDNVTKFDNKVNSNKILTI